MGEGWVFSAPMDLAREVGARFGADAARGYSAFALYSVRTVDELAEKLAAVEDSLVVRASSSTSSSRRSLRQRAVIRVTMYHF